MQSALYDAAGHRRSPVTMPGFHEGRAPRNKGRRTPAVSAGARELLAYPRRDRWSSLGVITRPGTPAIFSAACLKPAACSGSR
jgi:hypothetical protein